MLLICRLPASAFALALVLTGSPEPAQSADSGSTVTGSIELAPEESRKPAPKRGKGFVPPAKNPLRPPDGLDPRYSMVVVLDGGPVDDADRKPRASRYSIIGENFQSDVLPVVIGGKVEIQNLGRKTPRLYSKTKASVVPSDPINKKGVRVTEPITEVHKTIDVRDQDSVHFLAHIVAFEHAYFAQPDFNGNFEIKGVPPGTWQIKVWYRDAWVTNLPKVTVAVGTRGPAKPVKITLPTKLRTEPESK